LNLEAEPELPESPSNAATCCAASSGGAGRSAIPELDPGLQRELLEGSARAAHWIDVRESWEYEHGRIQGTRNVPLSVLGFALAELRTDEPLTIGCRSGVRSMSAARTLERLGVVPRPQNLRGGILAWQELGHPIEGAPAL